ncbi:MAG TPA: hypothetical protein VES36_05360, partial [Candidatus Limnocylindrales bacterium]|nr:hypothetical protein [Candidatus Limnocylindrales bacterium]
MSGPLDQLSAELDPPPDAPRVPPRAARLAGGGRSLLIAAVSTVVVFTLLGLVAVNAPGWDRVSRAFLDSENFWESAPGIVGKFGVNVALFVIAEILILAFALV